MRDFSHFLWRCIETTVRPVWDTATAVGLIITVILAVILITQPEKQQSATVVLSKILVLLLVIVFLARLVASPYLVYRSRDHEVAERDGTIKEQKKRIDELENNNELGKFLKQQSESSKKGSLSNRASTLANQILEAVEARRKEDDRVPDEQRSKSMAARNDPVAMQAAWDEMTRKYMESSAEFDRLFHQRFTPRIIALADEFRENGLTDPKLDQWVQRPHTAAYTFTLTEVAVALSQLAIKMEDKEKGAAHPMSSAKKPD